MSFFSKIGSFFKTLFGLARPGLELFLKQYQKLALAEIERLGSINNNKDFHIWKDQVWQNLNAQINKDKNNIAGNWITILIGFAFEEWKKKKA